MSDDSILNGTKRALSLDPEYKVFDPDIMMHINSVFMTLNQLGVGPTGGYEITDEHDAWSTYLGGDPNLNVVKSYMYLRVRLMFDPPATSFTLDAFKEQVQQLEWRLALFTEQKDPYSSLPIMNHPEEV